ncbi:MAG: hypothetical protein AcusKO_26020 [Acuticoccus sp.]
MPTPVTTRADAQALDRADPLSAHRDAFLLPEGVIYLDGNSLGPVTKTARARVAEAVAEEWADGLIRSWNTAGWIDLPARVAARIAPLIGARPDDIAVGDSTSVNLFKVLSAALDLAGGRTVILSEPGNFPTDLYVAEGIAELKGAELRLVNDVAAALDQTVAVVMVTQVDYRTGRMHDMAALTEKAHAAGALVIWDLAHSAGAFPVDLSGDRPPTPTSPSAAATSISMAAPARRPSCGCRRAIRARKTSPLRGWFGHAAPFAFEPHYRPPRGSAASSTAPRRSCR